MEEYELLFTGDNYFPLFFLVLMPGHLDAL